MAYYTITNLEIGQADSPSEFCFDGALRPGEMIYSPFTMTLLQGEGRNILVDTGINIAHPHKKEIAAAAFIENCHAPGEVLGTVGVSPEQIDAVFLTHLHFDHAGGIDVFPNAVFYVQKKELEGWQECLRHPRFKGLAMAVDPFDLECLEKAAGQGRLQLIDGDREEIFPGIGVLGFQMEHSFASQAVTVASEQLFIISGDIGRYPENYLGADESGDFIVNVKFAVGSAYNIALAYERIFGMVQGNINQIVMTHDGTKVHRFPSRKSDLGLFITNILQYM